MKRVILDTNIYGNIAIDPKRLEIVKKIIGGKELIVYGNKIIRNELRDVPKKIKVNNRNLRIDLLDLFDVIVKKHLYTIKSNVDKIAGQYYLSYKEFGGFKPKEKIISDFKIIAFATIHELDIVVSNDEKTMLTENAIRAYKLVNSILNKRTPNFIDYNKFKMLLGGRFSNEII